jgi:hypothetical protein
MGKVAIIERVLMRQIDVHFGNNITAHESTRRGDIDLCLSLGSETE